MPGTVKTSAGMEGPPVLGLMNEGSTAPQRDRVGVVCCWDALALHGNGAYIHVLFIILKYNRS